MTVTDPTRCPTDSEWPLTRAYARSNPSYRERVLRPEVTVGDSLISDEDELTTGFGRKFVDLAGGLHTTPTVVETKSRLTSSSLYSAVGQALLKRHLFAADYGVQPEDVETTVLFGDVAFSPQDPPQMVSAIGTVLSEVDIEWVVSSPSSNKPQFISMTESSLNYGGPDQ